MGGVLESIKASGVLGLASIVLGVGLLGASIAVVALSRRRKPIAILLALAFLPLLVGALGTWVGYSSVDRIASMGAITSEEIERGRSLARFATYMGAVLSAPAVIVGLVGLALKGSRKESEG